MAMFDRCIDNGCIAGAKFVTHSFNSQIGKGSNSQKFTKRTKEDYFN